MYRRLNRKRKIEAVEDCYNHCAAGIGRIAYLQQLIES